MRELTHLLKAVADESRLRILGLLLRSGELCVCDIQATTGFTQTKVSRHLSYLKRAGLVSDRRSGLWMHYSITPPKTDYQRMLLDYLRSTLPSNSIAERDAHTLTDRIRTGCCAAFSVVKQTHPPLTRRINQNREAHK